MKQFHFSLHIARLRHILLFIHSHLVSLTSTCVIYASLKIFCNLFSFTENKFFVLQVDFKSQRKFQFHVHEKKKFHISKNCIKQRIDQRRLANFTISEFSDQWRIYLFFFRTAD